MEYIMLSRRGSFAEDTKKVSLFALSLVGTGRFIILASKKLYLKLPPPLNILESILGVAASALGTKCSPFLVIQ